MPADPHPVGPASEVVALCGAAWQEPDEDARREPLAGRLLRIIGFFGPPAPA